MANRVKGHGVTYSNYKKLYRRFTPTYQIQVAVYDNVIGVGYMRRRNTRTSCWNGGTMAMSKVAARRLLSLLKKALERPAPIDM